MKATNDSHMSKVKTVNNFKMHDFSENKATIFSKKSINLAIDWPFLVKG